MFLCRYNARKGFFCQIRQHTTNNNNDNNNNNNNISSSDMKCLGSGKGRSYPPMDAKSESLLKSFYHKPNIALSELLLKLGRDVPEWLNKELTEV